MAEETDLRKDVAVVENKPLRNEIDVENVGRGRQLAPANASQAMTFAQMMARSDMAVPAEFRGNPGLCLGVTMDAMTFGFNPFALARCAYKVGDRLGYEAKVYAAALNNSGFLKGRPKFSYSGEVKGTHKVRTKDGERDAPAGTLKCKIIGHILAEDGPVEWETPELGQIKIKNSPLWFSDQKLALFYYGIRSWVRVHLPEVMLGIQTDDELRDSIDFSEAKIEQTPKRTLVDRVTAFRAIQDKAGATDTEVVDEALEETAAKPAETEPADTAPPPEPKRRASRKKKEPEPAAADEPGDAAQETAPPPAEAKQAPMEAAPEPEPAPAAQELSSEPHKAKTFDEAKVALEEKVKPAATVDDLDIVHKDWLWSITDLTNDEQFDLQAEADVIVSKRRLEIRRAAREAKS